jgi:hypothetical protein
MWGVLMKKMYFFFSIVFVCFIQIQAFSAQRTVSNNPSIVAQYSDLQTAVDSSSSGDTIYVYHGANNYGTITLNKKITIYGAGYYGAVVAYQNLTSCRFYIYNDSVSIKSFYCDVNIGNSSKLVKGITISNILGDLNLDNVDGCLIYNCLSNNTNISPSYSSDNIIISNCFITKLNSTKGNVLITNNIFPIVSACQAGGESVFGTGWNCTSPSLYLTVENNIFLKASPNYVSFSSFNNNLTFSTNQNTLPYGNNTGDNNISNQDPKFVGTNLQDWTNVSRIVSNWLDFRLADDSPAKNAGTDSTDIGVSGGKFPWPRTTSGYLDYYGAPNLPTIESFNLKNTIVGKDGNLKLNVKGRKGK